MEKFDLCILGCGPGGFAAAMRGLDFGKHVCIIEKGNIGGAGIIGGAMTSKTMWELAKDFSVASRVDRGYRASNITVDYEKLLDTVIRAAKEKQYQILSQIESYSKDKWADGSLTLIEGKGTFKNKNLLEVQTPEEVRQIEAKHFIIATGSRPRPFPNIPFDEKRIISSNGILNLKDFPKRMMIIGAGIIGCEFATIFSNFKQTEVYLLDHQSRIIPFEDEDLSDLISNNLKDNGVTIIHNAVLTDIVKKSDCLQVKVDYKDGHSKIIEVDIAFISIGRIPNTDNIGLENIGIKTGERGHIPVDGHMKATDNIYAIGDITGNSALVNVAEMEGRYAVKSIVKHINYPLKYDNMSTIMFFRPEVAAVGLNEKMCRAKQIPHRVAFLSLDLNNRAIAMRATSGFVKVIVSTDESPKILGLRAAGPRASDLIISIAIAMDHDRSLVDVMRTTQPHPAISEAIQSCLRLLMGKSIFKPRVFPESMKITAWSPLDPN